MSQTKERLRRRLQRATEGLLPGETIHVVAEANLGTDFVLLTFLWPMGIGRRVYLGITERHLFMFRRSLVRGRFIRPRVVELNEVSVADVVDRRTGIKIVWLRFGDGRSRRFDFAPAYQSEATSLVGVL